MAKGGKRTGAGRKRKPTELRVLEGSFRPEHANNALKVGSFPEPPANLSESELKLWQTLPKVAWIGESDVLAVHGAVAIYDRILRNQRAQQATPEAGNPLAFKVAHDADGGQTLEPKENPLITQEIKLWARLWSMLASLGLTPADRAKMQTPKRDEDAQDKWAGLL